MVILTIVFCIAVLIVMIGFLHINAFLSFLGVSLLAGILLGLPSEKIFVAFQKGIGDTIGSLVTIIVLGAMLGKLIAESGAAQKIASTLANVFGVKHLQWALLCTGFIVGTTMFYGVGFVLLTPLIFSVVYQYKLPAVYMGLPTLAALSVTHGFLPPHPAPTALVTQLGADMGMTLFYGFIIAIPAILVAGPLFSLTTKKLGTTPLSIFQPALLSPEKLPKASISFLTALMPVLLLTIAIPLSFVQINNKILVSIIHFVSNPTMALFIALISATYLLGIRQNRSIRVMMGWYETSIKDISMILLIIGGAGALKQVFVEAGVDKIIAGGLQQLMIQPLVLGWLIAAVIRIALGSSTIAGLMTAGIIHPVLVASGANANLMVLSIGAGSMICSHVNDSGFWLFKEYFSLTMKETFLSFTLMETLVAIMGLLGVLTLDAVL